MSNQYPPPPPPQGGYAAGQPAGPPPPNYLVMAILSIFCCTPLGIAAIIFATKVNSKWQMGDVAGAQDASKKAKLFAIIAIAIGVVIGILQIIVITAGGMDS